MLFGTREFDPVSGQIRDESGTAAELRPHSAEVLRILIEADGAIVSKDDLLARAWPGVIVSEDSLYQCITEIRRALGPDGRDALKTVPRRGYRLQPQTRPASGAPAPRRRRGIRAALLALALALVALGAWQLRPQPGERPPTLSVATAAGSEAVAPLAGALDVELRVVLGRYHTVALGAPGTQGDFHLAASIRGSAESPRISVELTERESGQVVHADALDGTPGEDGLRLTAARLGATVASPIGGAITTRVFQTGQGLPVDRLSRIQCYATGFRIQGSGDDETARRAEACLGRLIAADPQDARALALLAALHAHQYWWSTGLEGPARDDIALRRHLVPKAVELASRAEALSPADDSAIYFSMGRAYYAACETEKVLFAAERALALNPDDPNLLGAFGNWLAYSGAWDRGEAAGERAVAVQPRNYSKWWYWTLGKAHWRRGEYAEALEDFRKSYNERNWLSHLQLAYTLPALGRDAEAAEAVRRLRALKPRLTRDDAADAYRVWCFGEDFIGKMDRMLARAGLPSRAEEQALAAKPSIAVLPLQNLSGSERWTLLARALATDIANDLARNDWLYVTAPGAAFDIGAGAAAEQAGWTLGVRFVLSGSVQAEGGTLRISARLTDAAGGEIVWSERWERPESELFAVQDEILGRIDSALGNAWTGAVAGHARQAARLRPTDSLTAWELYHLGIEAKHAFTPEGYARAAGYLERAIEADPGFGKAWAALSIVRLLQAEQAADRAEAEAFVALQIAATRKAIALSPEDPDALIQATFLHALEGDQEAVKRGARRAVEVAPNNADVLATAAWATAERATLGMEAVAWAERARELNPAYPRWYDAALGTALFYAGEYARATAAFETGIANTQTLLLWAVSEAYLGDEQAAAAVVARLRRIAGPDVTVQGLVDGSLGYAPESVVRLINGARIAGLPITAADLRTATTPAVMPAGASGDGGR